MDQFLGETGSKWGLPNLIRLFEISFAWDFQWYIEDTNILNE